MAAKIWDGVLSGSVTTESVQKWLGPKTSAFEDLTLRFGCLPEEFTVHFLKNIRLQAIRILSSTAEFSASKKVVARVVSSRSGTSSMQLATGTNLFPALTRTLPITLEHLDESHKQGGYGNSSGTRTQLSAISSGVSCKNSHQKRGKSNCPRNVARERVVACSATANSNHQNGYRKTHSSSKLEHTKKLPLSHPQSVLNGRESKGHRGCGASVSLGDFIVERKEKSKRAKNVFPRRINPTRLSPSTLTATGGLDNIVSTEDWDAEMAESFSRHTVINSGNVVPFTENWDDERVPGPSGDAGFTAERDALKIERQKTKQPSARVPAIAGLPAADSVMSEARLENVTDRDHLDRLVAVYCVILEENLALNPSTEIFFLTNLLVVTDGPGTEHAPDTLLNSVHNCVYFSCAVLSQAFPLLGMFDRTALKLLLENERILNIKPELTRKLDQLHKEVEKIQEFPNRDGSCANVTFNCETDTRDNFPSEFLFHSFKKQRDLFYEALETWEKGHILPQWSFAQSLGVKVKAIVGGGNEEPGNFVHFCRLFRGQLLGNCSGTLESSEDDLDYETRCFLKSLKSQDPNKYARLKERLIRPLPSHSGQRSDFPGHQEFYQQFILTANNAKLNAHMIDAFNSEIFSLSSLNLVSLCVDDIDNAGQLIVDDSTSQAYAASVASLRVLAKFLGFMTFLPYQGNVSLKNDMATKHAAARANTHPPVDVRRALQDAIANHHLVLTIPWVTKFLSMADEVSMNTPYYVSVTHMLFHLYATVGVNDYQTCPSTMLLVKMSLGWLFETANFPGSQFLSWIFDEAKTWPDPLMEEEVTLTEGGLDCIPLASRPNVLHAICPGLRRITVMLATRGGSASRHVTPAAVLRRKDPQEATQRKYEESFFHGQAPAVQRTVDFVTDRIASGCISYANMSLLPQIRTNLLADFEFEIRATTLVQRMLAAKKHATTCAERCWEELSRHCVKRAAGALNSLLPQNLHQAVIDVSAQIACRNSQLKVKAWLEDNMVAGTFENDLFIEIERRHRKALKGMSSTKLGLKTSHTVLPGSRNLDHDESACTPAISTMELRELILSLRAGKLVGMDVIHSTFCNLQSVCQRREDLTPSGESVLHNLLLDVLFQAVLSLPDSMAVLIPMAAKLWQLPELKVSGVDAIGLVSPMSLRSLSRPEFCPSQWNAYKMLLDAVIAQDESAPYKLHFYLRTVKNSLMHNWQLKPEILDVLKQFW